MSTYTIYDYDMNMNRARDCTGGTDLRIGGIDDILTKNMRYDTSRQA